MSLVGPGNFDPSNHWNKETALDYIAEEEIEIVNRYLKVFYKGRQLEELNGKELISLAASLNGKRHFEALKKIFNK